MWKSKTWYFFLVSSLCYLIFLLLFYISPKEGRGVLFVPFLVINLLFLVSLIFSIHTFVKVSRNKIISTEEGGEVTKKMTAKKYLFLILAIIAAIFVFFDFYIMLDYLLLSHLRFFLASLNDRNNEVYGLLGNVLTLLFFIPLLVYAGVSVFRLRALPKLILKILFTSIILFFLVITAYQLLISFGTGVFTNYAVGHIYVTFKDTTSKKDIIDLVNSYNLNLLPIIKGSEIFSNFAVALGYKTEISTGGVTQESALEELTDGVNRIKEKDKELNGENFIIKAVETWPSSPRIQIEFNEKASEKSVEELLNNLEDFEIKHIDRPSLESEEIFSNFVVDLEYKSKESEKKINDDVYRIKEKDKELNGENFIINTVKTSLYSPQIQIEFKENTTEKSVKELIHNFEELKIKYIDRPDLMFNVSVPDGEEEKWVEIFEKNDIVDHASLDVYTATMN